MQNRYPLPPLRLCVAAAFFVLSVAPVYSQFFNFTPPPQVIAVNSICLGAVSFGPSPTVVATSPGATVTVSEIDEVATGFGFNDLIPLGTYLIYWHVEDNQGHVATFEFSIVFADLTAPIFDVSGVPTPLIVGSINQVPTLAALPVTDNCSSNITQNFSQTTPPAPCQPGTFTRTWSALDEANNVRTYTQTIQVYRDSLIPTVVTPPQNQTVDCATLPGSYTTWLNNFGGMVVTDNSGIAVVTNNAPPAPPSCGVPVSVVFTATDNCGFSVLRSATFTAVDNTPPVVNSAPVDTIAYCGDHLERLGDYIRTHGYSDVTDACSPTLTWKMEVNGQVRDSLGVQTELLNSFNNPCGFQLIGATTYAKVRGYVRVKFFAYDNCNRERIVGERQFGVIDTTGPVITGPAITEEECGGGNDQAALQAWINAHGTATATDVCSVSAGWTNFSFTTSDGQSGDGGFNAGPYPNVPANNCNWYADVTFRAADDCLNVSGKTLRFRTRDTSPPVIGGFADTTVVYCPTPLPNTFSATVADNCATGLTPTFTTQFADTVCVGNYSLLVKWTATDPCGNIGTRTQVFVVRDTVKPSFTLVPAMATATCADFQSLPTPILGTDVQATDACGALQGITLSTTDNRNPDPNQCGHYNFNITRTFLATDACGNTRTATQVITVQDTQGPVSAIPLPDTTIQCQNLPLVPVVPPAQDQCSPIVGAVTEQGQSVVAGNCPDQYTIVVTWRAADVCGNEGTFSRNFVVVDTLKPTLAGVPSNITVDCDGIPAPPPLSAITASDNCDGAPTTVFNESEVRDPDPTHCAHWSNYQIVRQWTVTDACSNTRTYSQVISVMDNTAPELMAIDTVLLPAAIGQCGANVLPPTPLAAFDLCSTLPVAVTLRDTTPITGPDDSDIVCDTLILGLNAPNLAPLQPVVNAGTLIIWLDNADAEGEEEYFRVYGENGHLIGNTDTLTGPQCSSNSTSFSVAANLLNDWLSDGQLVLTLVPNGSGPDAVNAICLGRQVRADLAYQYLDPAVPVTLTYSIDGGAAQPFPTTSASFLVTGQHTVVYTVTDCAGNSRTASSIVRIDDIEPPLISAPSAQTAYVLETNCLGTKVLPFPGINENCSLSGLLTQSSPVTNTQFEPSANAGLVPKMLTLTVPGLIPNAIVGGVLKIRHRGDNGQVGEFFQVFDENDALLPATTQSQPGVECATFHETSIPVTPQQINTWAASSSVAGSAALFKLKANTNASNFSDWINPCGALTGGFDGISAVQAVLEYRYAVVNYEVKNYLGATVQSGQLQGSQTSVSLPPGNYTVTYRTADGAGNNGIATYNLTVRDTIRPSAICQNRTIFASVTGAAPYVLTPAEINNGSSDNCSGTNLTYTLSQTNFPCTLAGQIIPLTLTVADTSGNTRNCTAQVRVETESLTPTATSNVCEGGTVQLFSNPPGNPLDYTYAWSGPNAYFSGVQDPIISNAQLSQEGSYVVTITGSTGCTASGSTQMQLVGLPFQPTLTPSATLICTGQNLVLSSTSYTGSAVLYEWYLNNGSNLVTTTAQPSLVVTTPPAGQYQYFVRVVDGSCASALSTPKTVTVRARPAATVQAAALNPCEGEPIALGCTTPTGTGITYAWMGPNGYVNSAPFPPVFAATLAAAGNYTVTVSADGCAGTPATVNVQVRQRPAPPTIVSASQVCQGATVTLTAQPPGGTFGWVSPGLDTTSTGTLNSLVLNNVMLADSGAWRVFVTQNGCTSALSTPQLVQVQQYPQVVASANTPLCQGGILQLTTQATGSNLGYQWSGPNGFNALVANPGTSTPASGDYIVTVTTSFGCSTRDTVPVTLVAPPLITAVTSNAPLTGCVTDTTDITLFHTLVSPNGPFSYLWTFPNGTTSTLANPLIANVDDGDNGNYTLVVTDIYGCASAPKTYELTVQEIPPLPLIVPPPAVCQGVPITLTLQNASDYTGLSANFLWDVNGFPQATAQPVINLGNANAQLAGPSTVQVIVGSCVSSTSAPVNVVVFPQPVPPSVVTNSPVCEGDTLTFDPVSQPGVTIGSWEWTGPSGFTASIANPIVTPVVQASAGNYRLRVTVNGCVSDFSENIQVVVKPKPATPTATYDADVCLEQPDTLTLRVAPGTQTTGAQYVWYTFPGQTPLDTASYSPAYNLTNFSQNQPGANGFYVVSFLDGCRSEKSFNIAVKFDTIPEVLPSAGNDFIACTLLDLYLQATEPSPTSISGRWTQASGPAVTFSQPNNYFTQVPTGIFPNNTYQFAWTLSNGACKNYASDTVQVQTVSYEPAVAMPDFTECFSATVELNATPSTVAQGYWTQPVGQSMLQPPIEIVDAGNANTVVTGIPQGTTNFYYFIWNVNSATCGEARDTVVVRVIGTRPNAGNDQTICTTDNCVQLTASGLLPAETGLWFNVNNPNAEFVAPGSPITEVCELVPGVNRFLWQTNGGVCDAASVDTVTIDYQQTPIAVPDTIAVPFGTPISFSVVGNDQVTGQPTVQLTLAPDHGTYTLPASGLLTYRPETTFSGTDELSYLLCNVNCPTPELACDAATVLLQVNIADGCEVPTLITPNGDGVNDVFYVPCLGCADCQQDNEVTIFNQWGDQVFRAAPYGQNWDGTYNGDPLPPGTYFWVVKYNSDTNQPSKTGFVIIQR